MPAFQAVHEAVGGRVRFVGLAVSDSERDARACVESSGVTYDIGRGAAGTLGLVVTVAVVWSMRRTR